MKTLKNIFRNKSNTDRKQTILIAALAVITIASLFLYYSDSTINSKAFDTNTSTITDEVHYHAAFRLFENGQQKDFSGFEYMNVKPCGDEAHNHEGSLLENIHLHDNVGDVVHIHAAGATWRDVFESLNTEVPDTVTAYNYSTSVENPLEQPVEEYQSMTFFINEPANPQNILAGSPDRAHIEDIESRSEACGTENSP